LLRDLDFPYHPHVTIAHDVSDEALDLAYDGLADFVARFVVDAFTLFERSDDGEWDRRRDFPLGLP
jgi:2'-5' RNA ligase